MRHRVSLPFFVNAIIIAAGALAVGKNVAVDYVAPTADTRTIVQPGPTVLRTSIRTVERKVRGRLVHVEDRIYVQVPLVVVHVDHRTIKVPAHKLPLRSAFAAVANPLVTVHIPVPVATTIYLPTTIYSTLTSTETVTDIVPTTITISVPLATSGEPPTGN